MSNPLLDAVEGTKVVIGQEVLAKVMAGWQAQVNSPAALALREDLFAHHPFTPEAADFLRRQTRIVVKDPAATGGGGLWYRDYDLVFLYTGQMEAALHEHSHGWWEFHGHRVPARTDELIAALKRLAGETDPAYARTQKLAYDYVHGIPAQHWPGMLPDHNDHEIFAGLASGTMGDMSLLPPYIRSFYAGLFVGAEATPAAPGAERAAGA